jgi:hypothetical protein
MHVWVCVTVEVLFCTVVPFAIVGIGKVNDSTAAAASCGIITVLNAIRNAAAVAANPADIII